MRIGIDLGGTKIEGILQDSQRRIVSRERILTPKDDYGATVQAITGLVRHLESGTTPRPTVGIGTPGAVSPATGLMKNCNSTWLNGRALREDLERAIGRPVRIANDADCFALSEAVDGAAAGAEVVFGVILGTGVGGGIVVRGKPLRGPNAIAGEWGHNPLPREDLPVQPGDPARVRPGDSIEPAGPLCYCGRRGCIETYLSGPGLAADHAAAEGVAEVGRAGPEEIVARAEAGDAGAERTLRRYESRLARALATVLNVLDPDVIVLGGGLSKIERLYRNVPMEWERWVFSDTVATRLLAPRHGDSSGVRGAASLWEDGAG